MGHVGVAGVGHVPEVGCVMQWGGVCHARVEWGGVCHALLGVGHVGVGHVGVGVCHAGVG